MEYLSPVEYGQRVQSKLRNAFAQDYPAEQTAFSFALGLFLTALPNLGGSILVLGAIGRRYDWANPLALISAVAILNPLAKSTVYVLSYLLGRLIFGPIPGITRGEIGLTAGREALLRLLVGNLLIAVIVAIVGYLVALYGVYAVRYYRN